MIRVRAEAVRNTNSAAAENKQKWLTFCVSHFPKFIKKEGVVVVELDQFKYTLGTYTQPLTELRDSL